MTQDALGGSSNERRPPASRRFAVPPGALPKQGELAEEMAALELTLPFTSRVDGNSRTETKDVRGFNDCALHVLFRVDRELLEAYRNRHADRERWRQTLTTLRDQLANTAGADGIAYGGVTENHLATLFGVRKLDPDPFAWTSTPYLPNAAVAARDEATGQMLAAHHAQGGAVALLISRRHDAQDNSVVIGDADNTYAVIPGIGHFVTLTPAAHPDDPGGQYWALSDPLKPGGEILATTDEIMAGLAGKLYSVIGARDATVRWRDLANPPAETRAPAQPEEALSPAALALKTEIAAYEDIQTGWGEKHRVLILRLIAAQSPAALNKHVGKVDPNLQLAPFVMDSLADKYPDRTHQQLLMYKNGDFSDLWRNRNAGDPRKDYYREIDETGVALPDLTPEQTDIDPIPIPPAAKARIAEFLQAPDDPHDDLTVYVMIPNVKDDPYQRVGAAFRAAPLARLLRDLGVLTGERFKRVQVNLLACNVGHNPYDNLRGKWVPGKIADDFAKALKALAGDLPDRQADDIVKAATAEDDAALAKLAPPPGFKLQVRAPNYTLYFQKTGHKIYMMVRDRKKLSLKSEMNRRRLQAYKSVHHLMPDGTLLKLPSRPLEGELDERLLSARIKLRLLTAWRIGPDVALLSITKNLWRHYREGAAEVVGLRGNVRYVVRMADDFGAPLRDARNRVEVTHLHAKNFPAGAGGVGQRFTFAPQEENRIALTPVGELTPPKTMAAGDSLAQPPATIEETLARRLKTKSELIDLVDLSGGLEELVRVSDELIDEWPQTNGVCQLRVAHVGGGKTYLWQFMPPALPEKRVYAVDRSRFLAADAASLSENQLFTFKAGWMGVRESPFFKDPVYLEPLPTAALQTLQRERRQWTDARAMLPAKLGKEWQALKSAVSDALAALALWRGYLREDALRDEALLTPMRAMIDASLAEMNAHQATLAQPFETVKESSRAARGDGEERTRTSSTQSTGAAASGRAVDSFTVSFDQDALWRIKKSLRQEMKRYADRQWRAPLREIVPPEETALTLAPDFEARIARFDAGELSDDDLAELQTIAAREDLDIRSYVLALACQGELTWLGADADSARPKTDAEFWASFPEPTESRNGVAGKLPGLVEATLPRNTKTPFAVLLNVNVRGEIWRAHAPIWDRRRLNNLFGVLERPARVAPELIENGVLPLDPAMMVVPYGKRAALTAAQLDALKKGQTLAFVVDKRGHLRLGANDVALTAGEPARIGGELEYDSQHGFFITNRSQYSRHRSRNNVQQLRNVIPFVHGNGPKPGWRWRAREGEGFAAAPPPPPNSKQVTISWPVSRETFLTPFPVEAQRKPQRAAPARPSPNPLADRVTGGLVRAAFEAERRNALFTDGGARYRTCLAAAVHRLDLEAFVQYVETLHRGRVLLAGEPPLDEETRRRLLEKTEGKLAAAAAHYVDKRHVPIQSSPLSTNIETWATLAAAFAAAPDETQLGIMGRIAAGLTSSELDFATLSNVNLEAPIAALQAVSGLDEQSAYPFAEAIETLQIADAPRRAPALIADLENLPTEQRAAALDDLIKADNTIAAPLIKTALERQLIAAKDAHRWTALLTADPLWNVWLDQQSDCKARIDEALRTIEENYGALLRPAPAISDKNADRYGELINQSLPQKAAGKKKAEARAKADEEWARIVDSKAIPPEHLPYVTAIRNWFAERQHTPGTFDEQETKARRKAGNLKTEAEKPARIAASKTYMSSLAMEIAEPSQAAKNSASAAKKKKQHSKQAPNDAAAAEELQTAALLDAMMHWTEDQSVPPVLLTVTDENKHAIAESLLESPAWQAFLLDAHRDRIAKATRKMDNALARLSCPLMADDLPEADRKFYATRINQVVIARTWHTVLGARVLWNILNNPDFLAPKYHACMTEVLNYLMRSKTELQGDLEDYRKLALADVQATREEEHRRQTKTLTLAHLERLLAAKESHSRRTELRLSDEEIAIFHDAMKVKENKLKRGENPFPPDLADKIADMSFAQLQEELLRSPEINALLEQRIKNPEQDEKASRMQKELLVRLAIARHELRGDVAPSPLSLVELYITHTLDYEKQKDAQRRRQALESLEKHWMTDIKAAVEKSQGKRGVLCLTAIRDYFLDRPYGLPTTIEDARELLVEDLEKKLKRLQPAALGEQAGIRDWTDPVKSDHLLEFLKKLYPDKQWTERVSTDEKSVASVVRMTTKQKDSERSKGESDKEESTQTNIQIKKAALSSTLVEEVIRAFSNRSNDMNVVSALLQNILEDHSRDEVLKAFVTNTSWMDLMEGFLKNTKPEAHLRYAFLTDIKKRIETEHQKMEKFDPQLGILLNTLEKGKEVALWNRRLFRHLVKSEKFQMKLQEEVTLELFPELRSAESLVREATALAGLAGRLTFALRTGEERLAVLFITDAAEKTSLDKARNAILSDSAWEQFVLESTENRLASDKELDDCAQESLEPYLSSVRWEWEEDQYRELIMESIEENQGKIVFPILGEIMNTRPIQCLATMAFGLDSDQTWARFIAQRPFAGSAAMTAMEELSQEAKGASHVHEPAIFNHPDVPLSDANRAFFYELVQRWEAINTANAVASALASAIGVSPDNPIPVPICPDVSPSSEFIVNTVSQIKDQVTSFKNVETTGGSSSYGVVDAKGNFDEKAYNAGLRTHLRNKLRAPGQSASVGLQDAIILTNLPPPDRCAPVTKDSRGTLWITAMEGKLHLDEYFKNKISADQKNKNTLRNIELVYIKKGQTAKISAENTKKSAQSSTQSVKSKKSGRKKK